MAAFHEWEQSAETRFGELQDIKQPTLVVICRASTAQKLAVAEIISGKARIICLDELHEPASRRVALSSATVLLAR